VAQRRGFREYLAGLLAPRDRNKTLTALAGAEPVTGAQHPAVQRLQFFLSESRWDPDRVNARRLELLLADPATAPHGGGVLVIDDSNTIRRSAELFLRQAGYEVILAEDGFDALSKISDHQPQVIFVDIMMPRLDGYQTCALIKQNPQLKSTPVIMLSSKDGVFDRARGRLAGSDRYLTKPFTKEGLIEAVNEYIKPASVPT